MWCCDSPDTQHVSEEKTEIQDLKANLVHVQDACERILDNLSFIEQNNSLGWINFVLQVGWLHFRAAGNKLGKEIVLEELQAAIRAAKGLSGLDISIDVDVDLDVGSEPPRLSQLQAVHKNSGSDLEGIELSAGLCMKSGPGFKFQVACKGNISKVTISQSISISGFDLQGRVCGFLSPMVDAVPIFAGCKVFFVDLPTLKLDFVGIASLGRLLGPLISQTLQSTVEKILMSYVAPGGIYVPLQTLPPQVRMSVATPAPEGYLMITVHEAKGVFGGDWSLFSKETSDPSVTVTLGNTSFVTSCINNTSSPIWDPPESGFLPFHNPTQLCKVKVSDVDLANTREDLGVCSLSAAALYTKSKAGPSWFPMTSLIAEQLTSTSLPELQVCLSAEYLMVVDLPASASMRQQVRAGPPSKLGGPQKLSEDFVPFLRFCSVRLMGMNSEDEAADELLYTVAQVTITPGNPPEGWFTNIRKTGLFEILANGLDFQSIPGGSMIYPPMKSKKARLWGGDDNTATKGSYLPNVSPHTQMMIERLSTLKNMSVKEIAEVSNMPEEQVQLLVDLQRSLKVVWHQAFHRMMEYPGGTVTVQVMKEDRSSMGSFQIDLEEVENSPGKKKLIRATIPGNSRCKDPVLALEIELKGFQRADLEVSVDETDVESTAFFRASSPKVRVNLG